MSPNFSNRCWDKSVQGLPLSPVSCQSPLAPASRTHAASPSAGQQEKLPGNGIDLLRLRSGMFNTQWWAKEKNHLHLLCTVLCYEFGLLHPEDNKRRVAVVHLFVVWPCTRVGFATPEFYHCCFSLLTELLEHPVESSFI